MIDRVPWLRAEIYAQGMNDLQDRIKTWFCSGREGFVEAFATHSRVFGNLCHATGFHHIADSAKKLLVVTVCQYLRQVLANGFITVEQCRQSKFVKVWLMVKPPLPFFLRV